ncbi:MAG: hypothetical protein ABW250_01735 [Pyrinomonadaceae bacterium]
MKSRPKSARVRAVLFACLFVAHGVASRAQEAWPSAGDGDLLAGTTRKLDDYGKLRYCSETARLDNFAITLRNEPGSKAYLLVYMGRDDMPAWKDGLLRRAADYLVESRRLDASRVKVVFAGYREERTIELWVVAGEDPAPSPSHTIDIKLDRTKAYQWDARNVEVEFSYDVVEESGEVEEAEPTADANPAEATAAGEPSEEEKAAAAAEEAETRAAFEKYEIAVERRGTLEEEPEQPAVGDIKVSLWWNVESFVNLLKAEPDARACLVYYYDSKHADRETVRGLLARAVAKLEGQFGLKGDRVVTVEGGYSPEPGVELWVVPRGAEPPKPKINKRRTHGYASTLVQP